MLRFKKNCTWQYPNLSVLLARAVWGRTFDYLLKTTDVYIPLHLLERDLTFRVDGS